MDSNVTRKVGFPPDKGTELPVREGKRREGGVKSGLSTRTNHIGKRTARIVVGGGKKNRRETPGGKG